MHHSTEHHWDIIQALNTLADFAQQQGDFSRALALSEEALALSRAVGDKLSEGHAKSSSVTRPWPKVPWNRRRRTIEKLSHCCGSRATGYAASARWWTAKSPPTVGILYTRLVPGDGHHPG